MGWVSPVRLFQKTGGWAKQHLFSSGLNTALTLITLGIGGAIAYGLGQWLFTQAQWQVISANQRLLWVGRYPQAQIWRLWLWLLLIIGVGIGSWGLWQPFKRPGWWLGGLGAIAFLLAVLGQGMQQPTLLWLGAIPGVGAIAIGGSSWGQSANIAVPMRRFLPLIWLLTFLVGLWLLGGGIGLATVPTTAWNGLLLTIFVALVSITLSFPLGVLFALGRQSTWPVVRWLSIGYIEFIRGLPLVGILFTAQIMFPLLLPPQVTVDPLARAIAAMTFFSAAYLAENVRGGLQAIPNGQWEAARALGLTVPLTLALIVLPQALKTAIPAIVGQFIGLFKDTSLLSIVGLVELISIARSITAQPEYLGRYAEVYLVIGSLYWIFCYGMSLASRTLESRLGASSP